MTIPAPARDDLDTWLRHHDAHAPGFVEGLYLVGSIALGNWQPDSDIDIIAVSTAPATDKQVAALRAANEATLAETGANDIDGPFVTWSDLQQPPHPVVRPWTLHREFHHDDGCFELNPVIWLTLATYGIAVRGPERDSLDILIDLDAVRSFIADNTAGYWRSIAPAINTALEDPDRTEFSADLTSWSVLGIARMLYTAHTGDIASKSGAGRWLADELPQHRDLIEHALAIREHDTSAPDGRETARQTADYMDDIAQRIASATRRPPSM